MNFNSKSAFEKTEVKTSKLLKIFILFIFFLLLGWTASLT